MRHRRRSLNVTGTSWVMSVPVIAPPVPHVDHNVGFAARDRPAVAEVLDVSLLAGDSWHRSASRVLVHVVDRCPDRVDPGQVRPPCCSRSGDRAFRCRPGTSATHPATPPTGSRACRHGVPRCCCRPVSAGRLALEAGELDVLPHRDADGRIAGDRARDAVLGRRGRVDVDRLRTQLRFRTVMPSKLLQTGHGVTVMNGVFTPSFSNVT